MTTVNNNLQVNTDYTKQNTQAAQVTTEDKVSLFETERCTDGVDDGSLGARVAAKNFAKGAFDSIVGGIKGMFTDDKGNFSLGKTALTVGVAAGCVLFPPAGYALCALGVANGAFHAGKGLYNAATAKTDAEAKLAWQEAGGGVATGVISRTGMKASRAAMKNTPKIPVNNPPTGTNVNPSVSTNPTKAANPTTGTNPTTATNVNPAVSTNPTKVANPTTGTNPTTATNANPTTGAKPSLGESLKSNAKELNSDLFDSAGNSFSNIANGTLSALSSAKKGLSSIKNGITNTNLSNLKGSVKNSKINKDSAKDYINEKIDNFNPKKLSAETYNAIVDALSNGKTSTEELIAKFGYENVQQAIKVILGEEVAPDIVFG